jgi:hypothetical protein
MLWQRPLYRFLSAQGVWITVFADNGEMLPPVNQKQAIEIVKAFAPEDSANARFVETLVRPDQWTLGSGSSRLRPMHKVNLRDAADTNLYVSQITGEVVMKTTRTGRLWGWLGAVTHWIYLTPLRERANVWSNVIVYGSGIGCVMCLSGMIVGLWRFSLKRRYDIEGGHSRTPYAGWLRWHHYFGLVFGLVTFTWILSGLFSMNPGKWSPGSSPTEQQINGVAGGSLNLALFKLNLNQALQVFRTEFPPKEIDFLQFRGLPYLLAYKAPNKLATGQWSNTDFEAYHSSENSLRHLLVRADGGEPARLTGFAPELMMEAAREAMPGIIIKDQSWLTDYDAYYYHRAKGKRLPVLRVKYDDPLQTWLYLDPHIGAVAQKEETRSRIERWIYHGLHSLDFPYLYQSRPLWDIVMIALSTGGCVLSMTAVVMSWRRAKRAARTGRFLQFRQEYFHHHGVTENPEKTI